MHRMRTSGFGLKLSAVQTESPTLQTLSGCRKSPSDHACPSPKIAVSTGPFGGLGEGGRRRPCGASPLNPMC